MLGRRYVYPCVTCDRFEVSTVVTGKNPCGCSHSLSKIDFAYIHIHKIAS